MKSVFNTVKTTDNRISDLHFKDNKNNSHGLSIEHIPDKVYQNNLNNVSVTNNDNNISNLDSSYKQDYNSDLRQLKTKQIIEWLIKHKITQRAANELL